MIVSGSYDNSVRIWDVDTGELVRRIRDVHTSSIFGVATERGRVVSYVILDFSGRTNEQSVARFHRQCHDLWAGAALSRLVLVMLLLLLHHPLVMNTESTQCCSDESLSIFIKQSLLQAGSREDHA